MDESTYEDVIKEARKLRPDLDPCRVWLALENGALDVEDAIRHVDSMNE